MTRRAAEARKSQQAEDGKKAMLDYEAEAAALRARTEKLRALRLAREAAAPPPPPKNRAKKTAAKKKRQGGEGKVAAVVGLAGRTAARTGGATERGAARLGRRCGDNRR